MDASIDIVRRIIPATETYFMVPSSPFDPATVNWVNAVVAAGGTVSGAREILIDNLILGLRADGLFTKLDRLWLHAAENTQSALIDIIAEGVATAQFSPAFAIDQGYTFNGITQYLSTTFNLSTAGGVYTLNSAHISAYTRTSGGVGTEATIAAFDGVQFSDLIEVGTNNHACLINDATTLADTAPPHGPGMIIGTRTASNVKVLYVNAGPINNSATASLALPNAALFIGARNNSGPDQFSTRQHAATSIGAGLSATDATNLTTRVNTYMTAIGANVF